LTQIRVSGEADEKRSPANLKPDLRSSIGYWGTLRGSFLVSKNLQGTHRAKGLGHHEHPIHGAILQQTHADSSDYSFPSEELDK
jgi:hypothetical protein